MSERDNMTIQILTGEAMWPDRINASWPGAQFIARAQFDSEEAARPESFGALETPVTWGVLVQLPAGIEATGTTVATTTDLGDTIAAHFDTAELLAGDAEGVVMAARYWELPWRYVGALRDAVAVRGIEILDEDPRDDAVTETSESE